MATLRLINLLDDAPENLGTKIFAMYGFLFAFNLCDWIWAFKPFHNSPRLLGTAALAYRCHQFHAP